MMGPPERRERKPYIIDATGQARELTIDPGFPKGVPLWIKVNIQLVAEGIAKGGAETDGRATPKAADRRKDAKAIQAKVAEAFELVAMLRAWHREFRAVSPIDEARELVERRLCDEGFDDDEVAAARVGCDPESLALALNGVSAHLDAVQMLDPTSKGRGPNWRADCLAKYAISEFRRIGLPIEAGDERTNPDTLLRETCATAFAIAGLKGRDGKPLDPRNAIRKALKLIDG